jgi:phage baseplate assembly protein gpV
MQGGETFLRNLLNALLPNRAAPALGRVLKVHEGPGKTKYSCDVRIIKAGTLEDTDQDIAEVPINPIWAGRKKRGVYALPQLDQVVIVEFLQWNPAYPFIAGIWSDEYDADEFKKDQFVITDGDGMKFIIDVQEKGILIDNSKLKVHLKADKLSVKNGSKNLFTILDTHFQNLIAMKTVGAPTQHVVSPGDILKFIQDKTDLAMILEA